MFGYSAVAVGMLASLSLVAADTVSHHGGLAHQEIQVLQKYASNDTSRFRPDADGWLATSICSGEYCVYANKGIANGRGAVMVTNLEGFERFSGRIGSSGKDTAARDKKKGPPFKLSDPADPNAVYVASSTVRRGTPMMTWTPALAVHQYLLEDEDDQDQLRLLRAAIQLLPDETRKMFYTDDTGAEEAKSRIKQVLRRQLQVNDIPGFHPYPPQSWEHRLVYPEIAALTHDCRPNTVFYIDKNLAFRATAIRRILPGEALTISYVDPLMSRADRQAFVEKWSGKPCSCHHCTGNGDLSRLSELDSRISEINNIGQILKDPDAKGLTFDMIGRYVDLFKTDELDSRMGEAHWQAALNYNYLGEKDLAVKHCSRAIQASLVETGPEDNNEVLEMRTLISDPTNHYSYHWKAKRVKG